MDKREDQCRNCGMITPRLLTCPGCGEKKRLEHGGFQSDKAEQSFNESYDNDR